MYAPWIAQWIPRELAIPASDTRYVLGYMPKFPGGMYCAETMNSKDDRWQYVTHWMPLPAPPEGFPR
jgi:hypothetical protein